MRHFGDRPKIGPAGGEVRLIPLERIKVDPAVQQRVNGTSDEVVAEYAQAMRDGVTFPPPTVFSDDDVNYHLADGFHRIEAYRLAHRDKQEIECEVKLGGHDLALLFACGANASHGQRRTNADKEKSVLLLLRSEIWSRWSNHEIARRCAVSHPFVGKVRDHLETFPDNGQEHQDQPGSSPQASPEGRTTAGDTDALAAVSGHRRNFARGGKQHTMETGKIGSSRPTASKAAAPPPSASAGPRKTSAGGDSLRMDLVDHIAARIQEISNLLAACDPSDLEMIRKNSAPYLDGWFEAGRLRSERTKLLDGNLASAAA